MYAFDRGFVAKIRNKSWSQRLRPVFKKAVNVVNYLARVAFGTALVVSAVVVWLAVIAITSSRDDNRWVAALCWLLAGPLGEVLIEDVGVVDALNATTVS